MSFLSQRTVTLGIGGGIAVFRVCELARLLMKRGATVRVVMTPNAQRFVTPLTFQALTGSPVLTDLFDPGQGSVYGHLVAGRGSDLFVVAPATADLLARVRAGMADDAVTTSALACRCPILLAPAMNTAMWENRLTQENLRALLSDPRFSVVGPSWGSLADGEVGAGRLAEPYEIAEAAELALAPKDLSGWKVLVTAGPTREHLDPVRFLSNPSTGRMGFCVARAARQRGASVILVTGPTELAAPAGVELVRVVGAQQMADAALRRLDGLDLFVAAAAVADQRPAERARHKTKKSEGEERLVLVRTPDLLAEAAGAALSPRPVFVGFAAETERVVENARDKLVRKGLDLVCANDVTEPGAGYAAETNRLTLIDRDGGVEQMDPCTKEVAAHRILDRARALRRPRS